MKQHDLLTRGQTYIQSSEITIILHGTIRTIAAIWDQRKKRTIVAIGTGKIQDVLKPSDNACQQETQNLQNASILQITGDNAHALDTVGLALPLGSHATTTSMCPHQGASILWRENI